MDLIVAMAHNGVIGSTKTNSLLWHIPADLKWFKMHTLRRNVVMGSKTWESLPFKLPNRTNIVISSRQIEGCDKCITDFSEISKIDHPIIIGGGQLYTRAMASGKVNTLIITKILHEFEGDVVFPINANLIGEQCFMYNDTLFYKDEESQVMHDGGVDFKFFKYRNVSN